MVKQMSMEYAVSKRILVLCNFIMVIFVVDKNVKTTQRTMDNVKMSMNQMIAVNVLPATS